MSVSRCRTLVSTNWLRNQLAGNIHKSSALRVLDASCDRNPEVDGHKEYYSQSHIPQASYFSLHKLCPRPPSSLEKFPVPDANRFKDYVESLGVSSDTHVIAYDRFETVFALKTWWLFKLFGHHNVSVLDGGFQKWLKDGYDVSSEEPHMQRSSFQPAFNPGLLHGFEDMVKNQKTQEKQVVDTRPAASFYNKTDKMPAGITEGGHLPGSLNIPYPTFFKEDGTFKSAAELKELLEREGVDLTRPVVATCQMALTANGLTLAALMLGKKDVPVYSGSFMEWVKQAEPNQVIKN